MRRYDDHVEVRKGMVGSPGNRVEGPEQFLWRGRLWKVRDVLAHWVETGPWWQSSGVHAVLGADQGPGQVTVDSKTSHDLLAEREVWRVEAARGRSEGPGVFDLVFDWAQGSWQLTRCMD
jgi:Family of unknown function (DUF6504)